MVSREGLGAAGFRLSAGYTLSHQDHGAKEYRFMKRQVGFALAILLCLVVTGSLPVFADSHVRIVRLSSVEGQVQIDRAAGQGMERAILNTPIVEGTRIVTGNDGLAEVEFENQTALRLTDDSEVKFSQLLMNDVGIKTNRMTVEKGIVYLDTAKGDDAYIINVGDQSVTVGRDSLLRLTANGDQVQVAVFKGEAQFQDGSKPIVVHKKETLTVDLKTAGQPVVAKGIEEVRYDNWNKERQDYTKTYADNQGYGGPNHGYGLQDLNYYGNFFYANGYGNVWQPYGFAGAMTGWSPYSNGAWMFYPGMGYSFASAYPWGWLPFHYGSWAFINGAGWAWVPGRYSNQWASNTYLAVPHVTKAPAGWTAPTPPAAAVSTASAPTVIVGKGGTVPLSIPGGRIPPEFGAVVPGRAVAATSAGHGVVKPNVTTANHTVFAPQQSAMNTAHHSPSGHVFAEPIGRSVFAEPSVAGRPSSVGRSSVSPTNVHTVSPAAVGHTSAPAAHR